jgi:hypothetical protein
MIAAKAICFRGSSRWSILTSRKSGGNLCAARTCEFPECRFERVIRNYANYGLGNMMSSAQSQFHVPLGFAGLLALAVEAIAMYALMAWIERRMTGWAHRSTMAH